MADNEVIGTKVYVQKNSTTGAVNKLGYNERILGEILSLSVATAIPLETLMSTENAKGYSQLYINLSTLYRNFHNSFNNNLPVLSKYVDLFVEEVLTIRSIVNDVIPGKLYPALYLTTAKSLSTTFPKAKIKIATTNLQKNFEELEKATIVKALAKINKDEDIVKVYDLAIKGHNTSALILTHQPLDLMSYSSFRKLTLLESHTGTLKNKTEWILKLSKNEAYRNLPFNILTIQILGDSNHRLAGMTPKIKDTFLDLATTCNWSAITTLAKVKFDIQHHCKDKLMASIFLEMSSATLK